LTQQSLHVRVALEACALEMRQQEHEIHKSIVNNEGSGDASAPCCTPESPSRLDRRNPQRSRTGSVLLLPDTAERAAKMRHIPILLVITSSQPSRRKRTSRALFGLVQSQDPNLVGMGGSTAHKSRKDTPFDAFVGCPPQEGIARW
jgi:hypothetical protein